MVRGLGRARAPKPDKRSARTYLSEHRVLESSPEIPRARPERPSKRRLNLKIPFTHNRGPEAKRTCILSSRGCSSERSDSAERSNAGEDAGLRRATVFLLSRSVANSATPAERGARTAEDAMRVQCFLPLEERLPSRSLNNDSLWDHQITPSLTTKVQLPIK